MFMNMSGWMGKNPRGTNKRSIISIIYLSICLLFVIISAIPRKGLLCGILLFCILCEVCLWIKRILKQKGYTKPILKEAFSEKNIGERIEILINILKGEDVDDE